ncbi:flavin-containing monooxygenase 1-like [Theristicus caerulescens]
MRVAVVGAGVSGLTATKCCLEEGLEPTCFEQSQDIGGLWRYTEHVEAGRPSLYPSVISNTSKEMSAFSDFPYPEDFPVFLPNAQLLDYLRRYTECFGLQEYIKFGASRGFKASTFTAGSTSIPTCFRGSASSWLAWAIREWTSRWRPAA